MQKQENSLRRHWKKGGAAILLAVGGYFAVPEGYEIYKNREARKESKAAQKQEDMSGMRIKPLVMNELFKGKEVGLYEAWLPFSTGERLCALRVEYNADPHRSVTIDYCLPPETNPQRPRP